MINNLLNKFVDTNARGERELEAQFQTLLQEGKAFASSPFTSQTRSLIERQNDLESAVIEPDLILCRHVQSGRPELTRNQNFVMKWGIGILLVASLLCGCASDSGPNRSETRRDAIDIPALGANNPWTHQNFFNDPDNFQFVIATDRTGGARPGVFLDGVTKANLLRPEFVISVGDLIEGGTSDEAQVDREWEEFEGFLAQLQMPFFFVPGNHDISNPMMARKWNERHGRPYYHFVYRNTLFLCLNTEDVEPGLGDDQIEYVRQVLDDHPQTRWTFVFLHRPLWLYEENTGWSAIESMLRGRRHTVFAGHFHAYTKYVRNDHRYIVVATMGGGSLLRGPDYGEFDHFVWVTVTDDGPVLANVLLEGIRDENVVTQRMREELRR